MTIGELKRACTVLGVPYGASLEQIKDRWDYLKKAHHPDKFQTDADRLYATEDFKRCQNAYARLSDFLNAGGTWPSESSYEEGSSSHDSASRTEHAVLQKFRESIGEKRHAGLSLRPLIPIRALRGAAEEYLGTVDPGAVLLLLDMTVFGSGRVGLSLTLTRLFVKWSSSSRPVVLDVAAIKSLAWRPGGGERPAILIDGEALEFPPTPSGSELARDLVVVLAFLCGVPWTRPCHGCGRAFSPESLRSGTAYPDAFCSASCHMRNMERLQREKEEARRRAKETQQRLQREEEESRRLAEQVRTACLSFGCVMFFVVLLMMAVLCGPRAN